MTKYENVRKKNAEKRKCTRDNLENPEFVKDKMQKR